MTSRLRGLRRERPAEADAGGAGRAVGDTAPAAGARAVSPLNEPLWRLALTVAVAGTAAFAARLLLGAGTFAGVAASAAGLAWGALAIARLLLTNARAARFWRAWLILSLLPLVFAAQWVPSLLLAGVFLVFRRYRPLRHLTSRRRAWLFLVAMLVLPLTVAGWTFPEAARLGPAHAFAQAVARFLLGVHQLFWLMTAMHLVFGMRLHFMRLRPKLAASAVLVAVVPMLLVILLWVVILFSALGAARSSSGRTILQDWAVLAGQDPEAGRALFDATFATDAAGAAQGEAPAWLSALLGALAQPGAPVPGLPVAPPDTARTGDAPDARSDREGSSPVVFSVDREGEGAAVQAEGEAGAWAPADTTAFFQVGGELWVLRTERAADGRWRARGHRVGERTLLHLAEVVRADISLYSGRGFVVRDTGEEAPSASSRNDSTRIGLSLSARFARPDSTAAGGGFWRSRLGFGASLLPVVRLGADGFRREEALLGLLVTPADLAREFWSRGNEFNRVVVVALITLAVMLLGIEAFAVFMGVRVVGGITGAVRALHQGTRRLAAGDLDTRIELPNEDELGDLAESFNEMTEAVRRGREEAIARERLERELRTAREIQERLLPHEMPELPGYEITGVSVPSLQVGGDYFDFLDLPEGRLGVAVADVSGKGIPAALLMANLQALLRGQVIHRQSVAEMVSRMNDLLARSTDYARFATFFYGVLERATGRFVYTNAGHNPPLLRRADGALEELRAGGLMIGMLPDQAYRQDEVDLRPGDTLVLFTDGITEAEGPAAPLPVGTAARAAVAAGEEGMGVEDADGTDEDLPNHFGDERLRAVVAETAPAGAVAVRDAVLRAVQEHAADVPPSDDITLVVIRRRA